MQSGQESEGQKRRSAVGGEKEPEEAERKEALGKKERGAARELLYLEGRREERAGRGRGQAGDRNGPPRERKKTSTPTPGLRKAGSVTGATPSQGQGPPRATVVDDDDDDDGLGCRHEPQSLLVSVGCCSSAPSHPLRLLRSLRSPAFALARPPPRPCPPCPAFTSRLSAPLGLLFMLRGFACELADCGFRDVDWVGFG